MTCAWRRQKIATFGQKSTKFVESFAYFSLFNFADNHVGHDDSDDASSMAMMMMVLVMMTMSLKWLNSWGVSLPISFRHLWPLQYSPATLCSAYHSLATLLHCNAQIQCNLWPLQYSPLATLWTAYQYDYVLQCNSTYFIIIKYSLATLRMCIALQ